VVSTHLESLGAAVVEACSAREALELIRRNRISVLLADIGMPGEDGYDLIRQLRALPDRDRAAVPAAALTAFAGAEDQRRALSAGFHMHLSKPVDGDVLVAAVAKLATTGAAS
jgi:CheY-like chemotaxis protein